MGKLICALLLLGCLNPLEESNAEKMPMYKNYQPASSAHVSAGRNLEYSLQGNSADLVLSNSFSCKDEEVEILTSENINLSI